jgi:hypothetical protein
MSGPPGMREAVCVYQTSDCPTRPGPWPNCGRRYEGASHESDGACSDPVGKLFAEMAVLEAESVPAFQRLAEELAAHAAPRYLVDEATRAARDEMRHTRSMTALARSYGAAVPTVHVPAHAERTLFDLAAENVTEGCVRETFGALVAEWQARHASDPKVRQTMRAIAHDELRHAALGWNVDAWARTHLSPDECAHLDALRHTAVHALRATWGMLDALVVERAGVPSYTEAMRLIAACDAQVWQQQEVAS